MNLDKLNPTKEHTKIGSGAIYEIDKLCEELGMRNNVLLVYDKKTKEIAGNAIADALSDYNVQTCIISNSDDLNVTYVEALIRGTERDFVIGIGGGKPIDVAKLTSYNCGIPWISVATVLSNDGFVSERASISGANGKESKKAHAPVGLIGDTNIILKSPIENWYAGVMDILSNETAVYDCKLAESKAGQKTNHEALRLAFSCSSEILASPEEFRNKTQGSIEKLIELGINSGKSMQIAGCSAPASGFEHKTSHSLDQILKKPKMHGLQCGVGTLASKAAYEALKINTEISYEITLNAFKRIGLPIGYPCLDISKKDVLKAFKMANKINPNRYTIGNLVEESGLSWEKILKGRDLI